MTNLTAIAVLVLLVSCGGGSGSTQGDGAVPASTSAARATTTAQTTSGEDSEVRTIEVEVQQPALYDSGAGVTLLIEDVRIGDLTTMPADIAEQMEIGLDDPNSLSFLIMTITVENSSSAPIAFYPDQSTALVGSRQVNANFWFSDSFTSNDATILDGATVTGDVYFELLSSADEVAALGQARYTTSGPADPESFETLGGDVDITVVWNS